MAEAEHCPHGDYVPCGWCLAELRAQLRTAREAIKNLLADLEDCILEVEGKAYLKDYVKASYVETMTSARAALAALESTEEA